MAASRSDTLRASWTRDIGPSGKIEDCRCEPTATHRGMSMGGRSQRRYGHVGGAAARSTPAGVTTDDSLCCPSLTAAPLGEDEAVELARVLAALGDPVRLR